VSVTYIQVAQLWQRDRAKLDRFSINVERYSQNHAQIAFLGHPIGASRTIQVNYFKVCTQTNFVAEFDRETVSFTRIMFNYRFWATLRRLRGNVCDWFSARCKACSWLYIGCNWTFFARSHGWGTNPSKSAFAEGVGHFRLNIRFKGYIHRQHLYTAR